jgi:hypothetical protein
MALTFSKEFLCLLSQVGFFKKAGRLLELALNPRLMMFAD